MPQTLPTPPTSPASNALPPGLPPLPSLGESPKEAADVNLAFAKYYWPRHFEKGSADPATFIDRVLTDYAHHEREIVDEWLENLSRLYIIYRACLNYGSKRGTRAKAQEAKSYQGRTLAREPRVQEVREHHWQLRAEIIQLQASEPQVASVGVIPAPPAVIPVPHQVTEIVNVQPITPPTEEPETLGLSGDTADTVQVEGSPPNGGLSRKTSNSNRRSVRKKGSKARLSSDASAPEQRKDPLEEFEELRKLDKGKILSTPYEIQKEFENTWNTKLTSIRANLKQDRHPETGADISISKACQGDFIDMLTTLWVLELRRYFQDATLPENLKSNPQLVEKVKSAMTKDNNKWSQLTMLSNFISGWDFSRLTFLVERLSVKDDNIPKLPEVRKTLVKCREARNHKSHYDGDPNTEPLTDADLLNLLDCTRKYLPSVNSQNKSQPGNAKSIYKRLRVLESVLFYKDKDVVVVEEDEDY